MKYRIKHFNTAWHKQWTLQHFWNHEGGGGWYSDCDAPFKWMLRLWAPVVYWKFNRSVKKIGGTRYFEL